MANCNPCAITRPKSPNVSGPFWGLRPLGERYVSSKWESGWFGSFNSIGTLTGTLTGPVTGSLSLLIRKHSILARYTWNFTFVLTFSILMFQSGTGSPWLVSFISFEKWVFMSPGCRKVEKGSDLRKKLNRKVSSKMLLIFLVIFQKCVPAWAFHVPPPPRASLYSRNGAENCLSNSRGREK